MIRLHATCLHTPPIFCFRVSARALCHYMSPSLTSLYARQPTTLADYHRQCFMAYSSGLFFSQWLIYCHMVFCSYILHDAALLTISRIFASHRCHFTFFCSASLRQCQSLATPPLLSFCRQCRECRRRDIIVDGRQKLARHISLFFDIYLPVLLSMGLRRHDDAFHLFVGGTSPC